MMLGEVVRKHLLKNRKLPLNDDDLEIAIYAGWIARNEEVEKLEAENARYREALKNILFHGTCTENCGYQVDEAREALKGGE